MQDKIDQLKKEAERLVEVLKVYPDVKEHKDRWNNIRLISKLATKDANKCIIKHNCGCCSDSPVEVWPYVQTQFGEVYSEPCGFFVGEKLYWKGDRPNAGWEEMVIKYGIHPDVIESIRNHFPAVDEDDSDENSSEE